MNSLIQLPGSHYEANQVTANRFNRTAATTKVGSVGFVDTTLSDGDSTTIAAGLDNVVSPTTALIAKRPILVVANSIAADNDRLDWIEGTKVRCRVLVDSTANIAVGNWLKPVNGSDSLVVATAFSVDETGSAGAEALVPVYAQALEARTADDEGTIEVLLFSDGVIL